VSELPLVVMICATDEQASVILTPDPHHFNLTDNPISRFRKYLTGKEWMNDELADQIADEERVAVLEAMEKAEAKGPPSIESLFEDVYDEKTNHLLKQERELIDHVAKYPEHYAGGH